MRLALRELVRRPGRFLVATIVLTFLCVLLLLLGGLLDGLFLGSTGAVRAQRADAITYSANARDSFLRSRIGRAVRAKVEAAKGVERVGGLGVLLLGAVVPGEAKIADVAVLGYELAPNGVPDVPPGGHAWADSTLRDHGADLGETMLVGPARTPIVIDGFVEDTNFLQQGSLWVDLPTWRAAQNANRPDAFMADDVVQVLVVQGSGDLRTTIDTATGAATATLTKDEAIYALPGVQAQEDTFNQIIYMTLTVVLAVVGLFFSLLTLERAGLYGVLKAIGASSRTLFGGVLLQATSVAGVAFVVGAAMAMIASVSLAGTVPLQLTPGRFLFTFVALIVSAVLGSALSLRRVTRIDPASAIGSAT
jgi:putative ABC transport system permease protein